MVSSESAWLHVWVSTKAIDVAPCLDEAEAAAMARFCHAHDQARYARAHSLKRWILADHYLCEAPQQLRFGRKSQGKPYLLDHPLQFNLSHSEDAFALAVSSIPVGVDIQTKDASRDLTGLAEAVFHPAELALWKQQDACIDSFFRLWTGKEAMVKAEGVGFLVDPQDYDGSAGSGLLGQVDGPTRCWRLYHAEQAQFAICVAVPADASPEVHWLQVDSHTPKSWRTTAEVSRPMEKRHVRA